MSERTIRLIGTNIPELYHFKTINNKTVCEGLLDFAFDFVTNTFNQNDWGKLELPSSDKLRYEFLLASEIGTEASPGNWTGAVGMLNRNEADVYAGHFAAQPDLFDIVGYTNSFEDVTGSILSGPPNKLNKKTTSLFSSVDTSVWSWLLVSWVVISVLYWRFIPLEAKFLRITLRDGSLVSTLLIYYGLLFQRGFDNLPITTSLRLLASGWLIFVIVFSTDLAGNFSSKLAVTDSPERIDRLQDLLKYPDIKPYISKGVLVDTHIMKAEADYMKKVWKQITKFGGSQFVSVFYQNAIMDEVISGEAVAISWAEPLLGSFVTQYCKRQIRPFYLAKEPFLTLSVTYMYRKDLDPVHVEALNRMATRHGSSGYGILNFRSNNQFALPCFKEAFIKEGWKPLTIADLDQIFKIWLFGFPVSFALLLIECFVRFYSDRNK